MNQGALAVSRSRIAEARRIALRQMREHLATCQKNRAEAAEKTWAACGRNQRLRNAFALMQSACFDERHARPSDLLVKRDATLAMPSSTAFAAVQIAIDEAVLAKSTARANEIHPDSREEAGCLLWEWSKSDEGLKDALVRLMIFDVYLWTPSLEV